MSWGSEEGGKGFLRVSDQIRWVSIEERVIILSLEDGLYTGLDAIAARLWHDIASDCPKDKTCREVAERFRIPLDRVFADYDQFIVTMSKRRFLVENTNGSLAKCSIDGQAMARVLSFLPLSVQAWVLLVSMAKKINFNGFVSAYSYANQLAFIGDHGVLCERYNLPRVIKSFLRAENFFISRYALDDCLLRSLALYVFLRRLGFPAEHKIGIVGHPFAAHAWVKLAERVIFEDSLATNRFCVLASLPHPHP